VSGPRTLRPTALPRTRRTRLSAEEQRLRRKTDALERETQRLRDHPEDKQSHTDHRGRLRQHLQELAHFAERVKKHRDDIAMSGPGSRSESPHATE
jgi:hypothetical protein